MTKKNEKKTEENELSNLENQLKRALADYQNLEKRIASEKSSWILASNKNLLLRLLPGLDSLLLAEKHTQDEGVKLSIKHFIDSLEAEGVKKIETAGKTFDPNLMEAITTQEGEEGKVLEEVRAGYMLFDQILRPAQVIVGKSATS
jgi:molecular chaperone GrpE